MFPLWELNVSIGGTVPPVQLVDLRAFLHISFFTVGLDVRMRTRLHVSGVCLVNRDRSRVTHFSTRRLDDFESCTAKLVYRLYHTRHTVM